MKDLKVDVFYGKKRVAQFESLSALDEHEDEVLPKSDDGWKFIEGSSCGSNGYNIYFNRQKMECLVYSWKENTGFYDRNGDPIYIGDVCIDNDGKVQEIRTRWQSEGIYFGSYGVIDAVYSSRNLTKVKNVGE